MDIKDMSIEQVRTFCKNNHTSFSVTQRIRHIRQPRGGYIDPRTMTIIRLGSGMDALHQTESIPPTLMGTSIDYLTRLMSGDKHAFDLPVRGALFLDYLALSTGQKTHQPDSANAKWLSSHITGDDDASIENAIRLAAYDTVLRAGPIAYQHAPVASFTIDKQTIENARTMLRRSLAFLDEYGPKVLDGFTFPGGYTDVVSSGDGDFTTEDTLWDFKVSKYLPTKEHTLQLLMYWRMGLHSTEPSFQSIRHLGTFNPRRNEVAHLNTDSIPQDVIQTVEHVIGYE